MRLFVAVTPPAHVTALIEALARPPMASLRWTTRAQWHVTLRFLGDVDDASSVARALEAVPGALGAEPGVLPVEAVLGPATAWFPGRQVLQVPVSGLDAVASAVASATGPWCAQPEERPFTGHLTLARRRGATRGPTSLAGVSVSGTWRVPGIELVSSVLGPGGSRYRVEAFVALS